MNHEKTCGGGNVKGSQKEFEVCGGWVSRKNYARHVDGVRRDVAGVGSVALARPTY